MTVLSIVPPRLAWLAALVLFFLAACGSKTDTEYFEIAQKHHAAGDLTAATLEVKNALRMNPKNGQARLLLGRLQNDLGHPGEAEQEIRRALELGLIEGGRVHAELARALVAQNEAKKALEIKPLESFETEPLAVIHAMRGQAFLLLNDLGNARKSLEAAEQSAPQHDQTTLLRARIQFADRKPEDALATLDALLKAQPGNADANMLRADLLNVLKRGPEVAAAYDAVLSVRKDFVPAHLARGLLMISLGKFDEARKNADAILKISRQIPAGHYLRALLLLREGKLEDADGAVAEALKLRPDYPAAELLAGAIAHARGSYVHAEQILSRYLAKYPGSLTARNLLARTQLELKKNREAFETLEPMLSEENRNNVTLALAGDALLRSGDIDGAGRFYERSLQVKPEDPRTRTALAVVQLSRGETERGIAELEAVIRMGGSENRADYILIAAHYGRGDYDKALEAIKVLEAKTPKSALPHNLAGMVHLARKDLPAARKSFERALELEPAFMPAAINLADLDLKDNRPADAQRRFERIVAKDPKNLTAMLALSELAAKQKDTAAFVKWLEAAHAAHPSALEPLGRLSAYYLASGNNAKALEYAQLAAARNASSTAALDILGTAQLAAGDSNAAVQTYTKLVQAGPAQPVPHYRLGAARQAAKDLNGAEASFRKAIDLNPNYLEAWVALASVQLNLGKSEPARTSAAAIRKLAPKSPHGYLLDGEALLQLKRNAEAAKAFEASLALTPNGASVVKIYIAHTRAGNRAAGIAALEKWVDSNPKDQSAATMLANAYMVDGRYKDAAARYEKLVAISPKNVIALNNLAMSYLALKDPKAVDTARKAYDVAADDVNVLDTYGWILVENGRSKEGLPILEKAKGLQPSNEEVSYHFAVALARSGEKERAKRELQTLLALKKSPYAERARALLNTL